MNTMDATTPRPENVQGNIFGGFLKDHQAFVMCHVTDAAKAIAWIRQVACDQIATSREVLDFNSLFSQSRKRRGREILQSSWLNVAFTRAGLATLGVADADIAKMDPSFAQLDHAAHARSVLGDQSDSDPSNWLGTYQSSDIVHMIAIAAADDPEDLDAEVRWLTDSATTSGFEIVGFERGIARRDHPGHEHFGFKDGISQPAVDVAAIGDVSAWQFVVNAKAQPPAPSPQPAQPAYVPGTQPVPTVPSGPPAWAHEGSYTVFRRLRQRVSAFRKYLNDHCPGGMRPDLFAAKFVGRYRSGAPLEQVDGVADYDPSKGEPTEVGGRDVLDASNVNRFMYDKDTSGLSTPLAAHIRKVNPRDAVAPGHRILRRGIAYGTPFDPDAADPSPAADGADRGLLFVCCQASIQNQFEFIQQTWANRPDFPTSGAGVDPIIGAANGSGTRSFAIQMTDGPFPCNDMSDFVLTTGSLYLFQPSIGALKSAFTTSDP